MSTVSSFEDLRATMAFVESSELLSKSYPYVGYEKISFFAQSPESFAEMVRELHGTIDSPLIKFESGGFREVSMIVSGKHRIEINLNLANHCEQTQVGTRLVEREVVVTPAVTTTEMVEEPILEWSCAPVLAVNQGETE